MKRERQAVKDGDKDKIVKNVRHEDDIGMTEVRTRQRRFHDLYYIIFE